MQSDGTYRYSFDAENRIACMNPDANWVCNTNSITYTYDANGRRVQKSSGTNYWYGPGGGVLAETDSAGNWTNYIFFAGQRLARNVSGDIKYYITDHLHSTGMFLDKNGTTVLDDNDFYPWGGVVPGVGSTTSNNTVKFTGQYRDTESQLDYFGARYYSNTIGRFMSPDWAARPTTVPYAKFGDPQSLNLYSYVENGPVNRIDGDGHSFGGNDGVRVAPGYNGIGGDRFSADAGIVTAPSAPLSSDINGLYEPTYLPDSGRQHGCFGVACTGHEDGGGTGLAAGSKQKQKQKQKKTLVVVPDNDAKGSTYDIVGKKFREREVTYRVYTFDEKTGTLSKEPEAGHVISLVEKGIAGKHQDAGICSPGKCDPSLDAFVDTQRAQSGQDYTVERRWYIDNKPAKVFGNGTYGDMEILDVHYSGLTLSIADDRRK